VSRLDLTDCIGAYTAGIAERTLTRASRELGVQRIRGGRRPGLWRPEEPS
jgi:hypothetical protein